MNNDAQFIVDNYDEIDKMYSKGDFEGIYSLVFPKGIDLKMHQNIDIKEFKQMLIHDLVIKFDQIKRLYDETGKLYNNQFFSLAYARCPTCAKTLWLKCEDGEIVLRNQDELTEHIIKNHESKNIDMYSCFDISKPIEYRFKTTTDKFVIANDLRNFSPIGEIMDKYSVSKLPEVHAMTTEFTENGMFIGYVGNTTCEIGKTEDNKIIVVNTSLEEYYYDESDPEETKEFFEWLEENYFDKEHYNKYVKPITDLNIKDNEYVSCALWWIMGADLSMINESEIKTDYVILDVEPNTEYKFTVDYKISGSEIYYYSIEKV